MIHNGKLEIERVEQSIGINIFFHYVLCVFLAILI